MLVVMVRIPVGSSKDAARLEERFRNRAGMVDSQHGFRGFELLKGKDEYISVTRWENRESLDAWMRSQGHANAHGGVTQPTGGGHPQSGPQMQGDATPGSGAGDPQGAGGAFSGSSMIYEIVIPSGEGA